MEKLPYKIWKAPNALLFAHKSFAWPIKRDGWVFANGLGNWGSIPGCVLPKIQEMVFDASLLSTQHYKVWIKGK